MERARGGVLLISPDAVTSVSATQPADGRVDDRIGGGVVEGRVAGDQAVHRRPENQVDRDLGVDLCAQLAPRDTAIQIARTSSRRKPTRWSRNSAPILRSNCASPTSWA